jgi:hypothetical protein
MSDKQFKVTATTTITATFEAWAEDEESAKFDVENALVTGEHNFDFGVDVNDAINVSDTGWDVSDVEEA